MGDAHFTPVEEFQFILHDVLRIQDRADIRGYADLTPDLTLAVLDGIAQFSRDVLAPLNAVGDEHGCAIENGVVRTPPGFAQAYRAYCEAGWHRLGAAETYGGTDLPGVLTMATSEIISAANSSFSLYPALTRAAMMSIERAGDDWMRAHVVPRVVAGDWAGTMCLTEPHCGTDLKLMTTKAMPLPDGRFRIDGTKIFISGGDHDLTDNVVHLVLAKLPDAAGQYIDDLSTVALFLVPKIAIEPDGSIAGQRNGVSVGGVEKKMGLKGSATCTLNFDGAIGWKLGSTKKDGAASTSSGMSAMFDMMNHARLGTGVQALATASPAYYKSAGYARERVSGRAADPANRSRGRADPIIVHPDVRRMLMKQAAFLEGGRALALWVAMLLDAAHEGDDPDGAKAAGALASLLTPVVKAFYSDRSFECSNLAVQIYGGHGYIRETGVEQSVRDGRIFQLYEGANGIQAFDLVARKMPARGGAALVGFVAEIERFIAAHRSTEKLDVQIRALDAGLACVGELVAHLTANGRDLDEAGAASYEALNIIGIVAIGFMWARIGVAALAGLARGEGDPLFHHRKLALGSYWAEREMPQTGSALIAAKAGARTLMSLPADAF